MFRRLLSRAAFAGFLALACGSFGAAQDAAEKEGDPATDAGAAAPAKPASSLTEASPLPTEPKTADELFEAAILTADISRLGLSKAYLERLLEQIDEPTLLQLRDKYGATAFFRLANNKGLRPASVKLLELSNAAAAKRAADPERAAKLISLLNGTDEQRAAAQEELRASGPTVIPALLKTLRDPGQKLFHAGVLDALVAMGESAVPALIGALDNSEVDLRTYAATALGQIEADAAVPYLLYPAAAVDEAPAVQGAARVALARILRIPVGNVAAMTSAGVVGRLTEIARGYFQYKTPIPLDDAGMATIWVWKRQAETVALSRVRPDIASDLLGARFAAQALALAPADRKIQTLYLGLSLGAERKLAGWDRPLPVGAGTAHDLALSVGPDVVGAVLTDAIAAGRPMTAVAALNILEQIGTVSQLKGSRPSIVQALSYPDERVQFAAAAAILQLDPQATFPGASRVVPILNRALLNSVIPKAVIASTSVERGGRVGGFVSELGFEPVVVTTGKQAFRLATERLDVELIVLHPGVIRWTLSETLANLRADARTANIPIIIEGPADLRDRMQHQLSIYPKTAYAAEVQTVKDLESQVRPFLTQFISPPLSQNERSTQKGAAAFWLGHLAAGRRTRIFDISGTEEALSQLLGDAALQSDALRALGEIGSSGAQQVLALTALDQNMPEAFRTDAAQKLVFHIQRFGLLLGKKHIAELHRGLSAATDPDLHAALAGVIGTLKPDAALVGKRLRGVTEP